MQQLDTRSAEKQISAAAADLPQRAMKSSEEEEQRGRKGRTGGERAPCSRTRDVQGLVQEGVKGSDGGPGTFSLLRGQIRDQRNGARQAFSLAALNSRDDSPRT